MQEDEQERQRHEQAREQARARVHTLQGFYTHLAIFALVNIALFVINLTEYRTSGWWFYWVLLLWGIGLGVHAVRVFWSGSTAGRDWEERKIRELMNEDKER